MYEDLHMNPNAGNKKHNPCLPPPHAQLSAKSSLMSWWRSFIYSRASILHNLEKASCAIYIGSRRVLHALGTCNTWAISAQAGSGGATSPCRTHMTHTTQARENITIKRPGLGQTRNCQRHLVTISGKCLIEIGGKTPGNMW
jgi:hypothetical protein